MGQLRDEQRQRAISALNGFLSTPLSNLVQPSEDRGWVCFTTLIQCCEILNLEKMG